MRLLITGTDTGVGKTWVGCAIGNALRARGRPVVAVKLIETGCSDDPSTLGPSEDGTALAQATGQTEPRRALLRLRTPLTPSVAAAREGVTIELGALVRTALSYEPDNGVLLVEGAGGLCSPLTDQHDLRDVQAWLGAAVLVVAQDRLGAINHVRLSVDALRARRVEPWGVVLTTPATPDLSTGTNAAVIAAQAGIRVAVVPYAPDPFGPEATAAVSIVVDWVR